MDEASCLLGRFYPQRLLHLHRFHLFLLFERKKEEGTKVEIEKPSGLNPMMSSRICRLWTSSNQDGISYSSWVNSQTLFKLLPHQALDHRSQDSFYPHPISFFGDCGLETSFETCEKTRDRKVVRDTVFKELTSDRWHGTNLRSLVYPGSLRELAVGLTSYHGIFCLLF